LIFLIGWRGYLKNDAPEHAKIGAIQSKLIDALGLESQILADRNWKKSCNWALSKIRSKKFCVLVIRREFVD
jgi:sulfopyruvate decarboxylase TPP-binding subunit